MHLPHHTTIYQHWAPVVARVLFGTVLLMSAYFKIPGTASFAMQVEMSGAVGIPFPLIAVFLAFVLEVLAGFALILGWHARTAAFASAIFFVLIALFFYRDISDQATFGNFVNCLLQAAGLAYISVYGAKHFALKRD